MKPRLTELSPEQRMLALVVSRQSPRVQGGGFWSLVLVLTVLAFFLCCWLGGLAYGTEAPGCGNQHFRPRLSQCCPRFCAGEPMPNKCTAPLNSGFLGRCCSTVVVNCSVDSEPTPTPEPTCPPGWACWPTATPDPYTMPTPFYWPDKSSCCANVLFLYRNARHAIIEEKQGELKDLIRWKQEAMRQCREAYAR